MANWTYNQSGNLNDEKIEVDNNGNVYTKDYTGAMLSVDSSGTQRWRVDDINGDGSEVRDFAVNPDGGEVIVHFYNDTWYILDGATGATNATTAATFGIEREDGLVTLGNTREVYCLEWNTNNFHHYDVGTGTTIKTFSSPNGSVKYDGQRLPFNSNHVYIADDAGYLYRLNRSDFSVDNSVNASSADIENVSAAQDGSYVIIAEYDGGASTWKYIGFDSTLSQIWEFNNGATLDSVYDDTEGVFYHPGNNDTEIHKRDPSSGMLQEKYTAGNGEYAHLDINETFDETKVYGTDQSGILFQASDSEFTAVTPSFSASQVGATATMNQTTGDAIPRAEAIQPRAWAEPNGTTTTGTTNPTASWSNAFSGNDGPGRIAVGTSGDVVVIEDISFDNTVVESYQSDGTLRWSQTVESDFVVDLAYNSGDGNYYLAGDDADTTYDITVLTDTGSTISGKVISGYANAISAGPDGVVYYSREDTTYSYLEDYADNFGSLQNPNANDFESVAYDNTVGLYAGDKGGYIYDVATDLSGMNNSINVGVAVDELEIGSDGNLYGYYGNTVFKIDPSTFTISWEADVGSVTGISYDGNGNEVYVSSSDSGNHYRLDASTGDFNSKLSGVGALNDIVANQADTAVVTGIDNTLSYDDGEWGTLDTSIVASQIEPTATTRQATSGNKFLIDAIPVSTTTEMNVTIRRVPAVQIAPSATSNDGSVTAASAGASQFEAGATMISHGIPVKPSATATANTAGATEPVNASQFGAEATVNFTAQRVINTRINITDEGGNSWQASSILYQGEHPFFQEGETLTLTLTFREVDDYESLKDNVGRYLNENTLAVHKSFYNDVSYHQTIHPLSPVDSYLWKFEPEAAIESLDSWWVVVNSIEDATRHYGDGEQLTVELLALTPVDGETFTQINEDYEI